VAKVPLPDFKQENIGSKIFNYVFNGYVQNSAAYRFMSLKDFSVCEPRDAEFFEHIFPLKRNVFTTLNKTIPIHGNMSLSVSNNGVRDLVDEPRRSKRPRVESSWLLTFLQTS